MIKKSIRPFGMDFDLEKGIMKNPEKIIVRKASDMRGYYTDEKALEKIIKKQADPIHYEVFEKPVPEEDGHLYFCISKLWPGLVGNEYFMTKGHYHKVEKTAEIYLCLRGEGYMLMKTEEGKCVAEPMKKNKMIYVPPYWAHRSVNIGNTPLISLCVYPAQAGHNYKDIEKKGFPKRIYNRKGKICIDE
ncbi:MAG: glucose-6-phosphate isomerase family protein [Candidatus Firestonebacteria bacterium]